MFDRFSESLSLSGEIMIVSGSILSFSKLFDEEDVIYSYTSKQAEEDGILFDITNINKHWEKGLFNYVTMNLLSKGYLKWEKFQIANILDLLNQSLEIVRKKTKNFKRLQLH